MTKNRRRLKQVEAWLRLHHSPRSPVRVRVERFKEDHLGFCTEDDGGFLIRIRPCAPIHEQIETLLHEWAHAAKGCMNHGKRWGARHQRIYHHWFDGGGQDESRAL